MFEKGEENMKMMRKKMKHIPVELLEMKNTIPEKKRYKGIDN